METKKTTGLIRTQQAGSLIPSDPESLPREVKTIMKNVLHVNQLLAYTLTAENIAEWSISIWKIMPDVDPELIAFVLDAYKTDKLEWDKNKGIQNIFNGFTNTRWNEEEKKYEIYTPHSW